MAHRLDKLTLQMDIFMLKALRGGLEPEADLPQVDASAIIRF